MKSAAHNPLSRRLIVAFLGILSLVSGCRSMQTVNDPRGTGSKSIELRLATPRTVDARRPDGSPKLLAGLADARGRVSEVRGDSLVIHIESWRRETSRDKHHEEPWVAATFATTDPGLRLLERRFSVKRALLTTAVAIGLVSLAIGQADVGY